MPDSRLVRPFWRGRTNVDALTIACIEHAEQIGGHEFVVTQGSYQSSVAASAGTHDKGGAVDLRWCGHDNCVRALRQAGMAAWHRNPSQGSWPHHIHAVVIGHPLLAPSPARQVTAYLNGRNGLANNGPDDGPRLNPIPRPVWPPKEPAAMPKVNARKILHRSNYALANSMTGDKAAARDKVWIDHDLQRSVEGAFIVTHWASPKTEKFKTPPGRVPARPFRLITLRTIKTLRSPGGYPIRTAVQVMRDAKDLGVPGIEFELKFLPSTAALKRLAKAARKVYGKDWAKRVEIKMLANGPGSGGRWKKGLKRAKAAGFTTTVLRYSNARALAEHAPYVDKYRP